MELIEMKLEDIHPYERNPRKNDGAVSSVAESIKQCGYVAPIIVDEDHVILAGHTRLKALKKLGYKTAPVVIKEGLTDEQKRKYRILDNKTGELAEWDDDLLKIELMDLDFGDLDLDFGGIFMDEFERGLNAARENGEADEEYNGFIDKFKPKLTTDDCFTPPTVYEAAKAWAVEEYGWHGRPVVRPFYPGGDYQNEKYPKNCVVIDNPPFSIISEIVGFYDDSGIDYFLFAPHLTCLGIRRAHSRVICAVDVTYENGAKVLTSFVASSGATIRASSSLHDKVQAAADEYAKNLTKTFPKYQYPDEVMTATKLALLAQNGQDFECDNCVRIAELDAQKETGKAIFGNAYLISSVRAAQAAQAAQAARAAQVARAARAKKCFVWELSDREKDIIKELDEKEGGENV